MAWLVDVNSRRVWLNSAFLSGQRYAFSRIMVHVVPWCPCPRQIEARFAHVYDHGGATRLFAAYGDLLTQGPHSNLMPWNTIWL
jgi:hypothetical protein